MVGPSDLALRLFADVAAPDRWSFVEAAGIVGAESDVLRAIRGRRDATCRVAARLVRDGAADAFVSAGPASVTQAAASFGLGLLAGTTHPSLAVTIPRREVGGAQFVLVDAGASTDTDAAQLLQHAVQGSAYLTAMAGVRTSHAALLAATADPDRLDLSRRRAYAALDAGVALGLFTFGGARTPDSILTSAGADEPPADLVVTDGFTGAVLRAALDTMHGAPGRAPAVLLGFAGTAVLAAPAAASVTDAVALAAATHRHELVAVTTRFLAQLVAQRRSDAGLTPVATP